MKCGAAALLVVAGMARTVAASPIRVVTSGDACSLDALEPQVTALVGADPIDANAASTATIDVSRARGAYSAAITFDDGNGAVRGPRVVAAKSCRELVESVALVIAMALPELVAPPDVDAPVAAPAPTVAPPVASPAAPAPRLAPAPTPTAGPPAAPAPTLAPAPARAAMPVHDVVGQTSVRAVGEPVVRARPTTFALVAGGAGGLSSRGMAAGVMIGARVQRGSASLGVELRADAPEQVSVGSLGQIDVVRAQLTVAPCLHATAFAGCMVASVGAFRGAGDGLVAARSAYAPVVAGGLRLAWEHAFTPRLGVRMHFDVDALATTTRFDVDRMTVWASPRFEAGTGIGIVAHFP